MIRLTLLVGSFAVCLFTSCTQKISDANSAASEAAHSIRATRYTVGTGIKADNGKSFSTLTIEFSAFKDLPENYTTEQLSSIAAVTYFSNLEPETYKDYDKVEVTIDRNNSETETLYDITDLIKIKEHNAIANSLLKALHDRDSVTIAEQLDTGFITISDIKKLDGLFIEMDSALGKVATTNFVGFEVGTLAKTETPVFISHYLIHYDTPKIYSLVKLTVNRNNGKLASLAVNQ